CITNLPFIRDLSIYPSCSRCFSFRVLVFTSTGPCTDNVGLNNT
ncbi:unnamed protein product, partial [Brassica oleracea var. botrytis]